MQEPDQQKTHQKSQKKSFLATLGAVFWSFIGLRRRSDYETDATGLNPIYVILAALIGAAIFIAVLLGLVLLATR